MHLFSNWPRRFIGATWALWAFALVTATAYAQAPVITAVSAPRQVVTLGQNLTLSVTATDATSYQWKRNGFAVAGATAANYTITSAVPVRDNGWYQAIATNSSGSTTSTVVFVNVAVNPANILAWGNNSYGQTTVPTGLANVVAIAGGDNHSLALKADGTVVAWGSNNSGQTTVPTGLTNVVAIAGGWWYSLALKADGTVVAWGSGAAAVPSGLANVVAIARGEYHSLALKADGTVVAWGSNGNGQTTVPTGLANVVAIAGGISHSLALNADGTVVAWGSNNVGQMTVPTGLTNVVALAVGGNHSLALKADGTVVAWGSNFYGVTTVPTGLANVVAIAGGAFHSLALKSDGTVVAWGYNNYGQTTVPVGLGTGTALAAGANHSLVLRNAASDVAPTITTHPVSQAANLGQSVTFSVVASFGTAPTTYQWRKGGSTISGATSASFTIGEIVAGSAGSYDVVVTNYLGTVTSNAATLSVNAAPVVSSTGIGRYAIGTGQNLTLTLDSSISGSATVQWKRNGFALSGATARSFAITGATRASSGYYQAIYNEGSGTVTSAPIFVLFAPTSSQVVGWGSSSADQSFPASLTNAVSIATKVNYGIALKSDGGVVTSNTDYSLPSSGISNVVDVANSGSSYLALRADGTLIAWGSNQYGQISIPADLSNVVRIAAGHSHNLALKADGTVVAWGDSASGGTAVPAGLAGVVAVAGGRTFSLALKSDGTVVGWGNNGSVQSSIPAGLSNVVAISAGDNFSLALKSDGTVVAWGASGTGPAVIPTGMTNVVAIAAGNSHALALKSDGSVVAWGANNSGQTTLPAGLNSVIAVAAGYLHSLALRDSSGDLTPTITTQPASVAAFAGQNVTFSVIATGGTALLSYQWRKGGVAIVGATGATLALPLVSTASAGNYDVVITNQLGAGTSQTAVLTVSSTLAVGTNVTGQQVLTAGQSLTLTATAEIPGPVTFQWLRNGRAIAGATSASYAISNATWRDTGAYQVVATNSVGPVTSAAVFVGVSSSAQLRAWGDNSVGQTTVPAGLSGVMAVSAGFNHNLALKSDGTVAAWGANSYGQATVPAGMSAIVAVAAGYDFSMALKADGTVATWGLINYVPSGLNSVIAIAGGNNYAMALKSDGTVVAWTSSNIATDVPVGLINVVAIATDSSHRLALKVDGTVVAWGSGVAVPAGLTNVIAIAAGNSSSLALKADGTVMAWGGSNAYGEGIVPAGLSNVVAVAAGLYTSYAVKSDGTVVAWGFNSYSLTSTAATLTNVIAISGGYYHALALRDTSGDAVPAIATQPVAVTASQGQSATFSVAASGVPPPTFQWRKNGVNISGATNASFTISSVQTSDAGSYDVVVTNYLGSVTSTAVTLALKPSVLVNLSVRLPTPPEGVSSTFTISGTAPKSVLIRGVGPALAAFGVGGALADPQLMLVNAATGAVIASNNDWGGTTALSQAFTQIGAFNFPSGSKDSALLVTLPPGTYTAHVSGVGGTTGEVLLEVYDADITRISTFSYLSVKGHMVSGGTLIIGAVLSGSNPSALLVRAAGPSLGATGTHADPQLRLFNAAGAQTNVNDNWGGSASIAAAASQVGAFPFLSASSKDSAILATLSPGSYTAQVSGVGGTSGTVLLEFFDLSVAAARAPYVVTSPSPQTALQGTSVTFSVVAAGTAPLSYQWRKNGTNIGFTGPTATVTNLLLSDAGSYDVVVSNAAGSAVSTAASLTVTTPTPPSIIAQPAGSSQLVGGSVTFSVSVSGSAPFTYQWRKDGTAITSATSATLPLSNLQLTDAGSYDVVVSNAAGSVTSSAAVLTVTPAVPPSITSQPVGGTLSVTNVGSFRVTAAGSAPIFYQWRKDTVAIAGATGSLYIIGQVTTAHAGSYDVVVSNSVGSVTSAPAVLIVIPAGVTITSQPVSVATFLGATATLSVSATGSPSSPTFQWRKNGVAIVGATNSSLVFSAAQLGDAGTYDVVAANSSASVTSTAATLTVSDAAPSFTLQPVGGTLAVGGSITLSVTAVGSGPLTYQWKLNGIALVGATTSTFALTNAQTYHRGNYTVVATNALGSATSAVASVNVVPRVVAYSARLMIDAAGSLGIFTIEGTQSKKVLLRAVGPGLAPFGITGLADPQLELFDSTGNLLAVNNDWSTSADAAAITSTTAAVGAFALAIGSRDSAIVRTLPPGTYTVRAAPASGAGGTGYLELYDADLATGPMSTLPYIAVRGRMAAGGGVVIGGLGSNGRGVRSYLIRAVGPGLGLTGVLANPSFLVVRAGTLVGLNDDWDANATDAADTVAATSRVATFALPAGGRDAALVLTGNLHAGACTVQVGASDAIGGTVLLELHDLDAARPTSLPPTIVSAPVSLAVDTGSPATLRVLASGTGPLTYQWRKEGIPLAGETASSFSITAAAVANGGNYSVVVENSLGTATSLPATLTVQSGGGTSTATQAVVGSGYASGGTVTITNTLTYTGTATSLGWLVTLPTGWNFAADGGTTGDVKPAVGTTGALEWAWSTPPASPVTFTYTVNVLSGAYGPRQLMANAVVRTSGTVVQPVATPNPLTVQQITTHTADTNSDFRLSLLELTRVIELYNARNGTTRTGAYKVETGSEDGFTPDPLTASTATVTLMHYHSADTNKDARLSLLELTRVIELYNTRAGTVRTGAYRAQAGTEDSYAPGP